MSKVLVIGDPFVSAENLAKAAAKLAIDPPIDIYQFDWCPELSRSEFREIIKKLERNGPSGFDLPAGVLEVLPQVEYLLVHLAPISETTIAKAERLKMIGTCRGGLEHLDLAAIREKKHIPIINVIRNAEPVADFTIGLMYATVRNIAAAAIQVKQGKWPQNFANDSYKSSFSNMKVGLVGLGHIGKIVAKRLNALGMSVSAFDPFAKQADLTAEGCLVNLCSLEELFQNSDVVSLHLRVVPETENLIDASLLKLMKPSAYLINTARPEILNQKDFIEVLQTGKIAGAGIDVMWQEPIAPDDPLLSLDNVVITSHIAGDTVDAIERSPQLLQRAINQYLEKP